MSFTKKTYTAGQTKIPADNLNEIQDEIIRQAALPHLTPSQIETLANSAAVAQIENLPDYLPMAGGTMVNSGSSKGHITFPGVGSGWAGARDNAAVKVTNGGSYTAGMSLKAANCTWDIATYNNNLEITKFLDTSYNSGSNVPTKEYAFTEAGITNLQGLLKVANGTVTSSSNLSGTVPDMTLYKTVYVLLGESLGGGNQYYSFVCPLIADNWGIYLPSSNDYYRGRVVISSGGVITVSMLSSVTRFCYIYVGL